MKRIVRVSALCIALGVVSAAGFTSIAWLLPAQVATEEILASSPLEHRGLPEPVYALAKLQEGKKGIRYWVAYQRAAGPENKPEGSLERLIKTPVWSAFLGLRYSDEEIFALWCHYYFFIGQDGRTVDGLGTVARTIYGAELAELRLHDAARLVTTIRSPSLYASSQARLEEDVAKLLAEYGARE
ncbi:MAG: hypothetical protein AAF184_11710 [Pseudomonadota bacterium]